MNDNGESQQLGKTPSDAAEPCILSDCTMTLLSSNNNKNRILCVVAVAVAVALLAEEAQSFTSTPISLINIRASSVAHDDAAAAAAATKSTRLNMFFAEENKEPSEPVAAPDAPTPAAAAAPSDVDFVTSDQEGFLNAVGGFLVDAFWLNSEHHQLGVKPDEVNRSIKMALMVEQASDLQDKYGEVMGKRLLGSSVIAALDKETKDIVGVVTIKETLLDKQAILEGESAEAMCKVAVATLGPKQRRQYKNASAKLIATELLSPDIKSICVLSNLAVSPNARRRGIANALCAEANALIADWGYSEMHLVVEESNEAARTLYEQKLGYQLVFRNEAETALRADLSEGSFEEIIVPTLVLSKGF